MDASPASYQIIADLLASKTGQQLTDKRKWRLSSALSCLYRELGISNIDQLVCLLDQPDTQDRDLASEIVEALLNNETYFFRDKPTFDQIPDDILPRLKARRSHAKRLSIWCAGCSTGQEVHSLAMLFKQEKHEWSGWTIDILGTDISQKAISTARSGLYSQFEIQRGLGVSDMLAHFDEVSDGWQLREETRLLSRFEQHNLLNAPPTRGRFDLILCRNVLLYFDAKTRSRAFDRLASALAKDGYLMLGAGENASPHTDAFTPCGSLASIFEPNSAMKQSLKDTACTPA